jgi:hypothetical protein
MANNVEGSLSGMRDRSRREFLTGVAALGVTATVAHSSLLTEDAAHTAHRRLRSSMWVFADAHVGRDKKYGPRESLADALRQSESSSGFDWDIALDLGDVSGEV